MRYSHVGCYSLIVGVRLGITDADRFASANVWQGSRCTH